MTKKDYMKPSMRVVRLQHQGIICTSDVKRTSNNAGLSEEILGGIGTARARSFNCWDDEDEDW